MASATGSVRGQSNSPAAGERLILAEQTLDPLGHIVEPSRRVQPRTEDEQLPYTSSTPRVEDVPELPQAISGP